MNNDSLNELIDARIQLQLGNFNTPPVATHTHNTWDANALDPIVSLTGYPVYQVVDASVAPTDQYDNGKFRFQVDYKSATPHFWFWAYLIYKNTTTSAQVSSWRGVQLN